MVDGYWGTGDKGRGRAKSGMRRERCGSMGGWERKKGGGAREFDGQSTAGRSLREGMGRRGEETKRRKTTTRTTITTTTKRRQGTRDKGEEWNTGKGRKE